MRFYENCFKFAASTIIFSLFLSGCKEDKNKAFAPVVGVTHVKKETIPLDIEAAGKVYGSLDVQIRAQIGGILKERKFKEGQYINKGESLFLIDPVPYQNVLSRMEGMLAQANTEIKRAKRELDRMEKLFNCKAVSKKEYDDAQSAYESAEANLKVAMANVKEAKINLDYTNVMAPISGVIRKENQTVGSLISTAGESSFLTSMVQTNPLHVHFSVSGEFWRKVSSLMKTKDVSMPDIDKLQVQVTMPNGNICPVMGKIIFIDNSEDENTSTVAMKAEIPNENNNSGLVAGQFVKVKVLGAKYQNPVVPISAVIATANGNIVYVVEKGNIPQIRAVRVKLLGNKAIVMSGLKAGEIVVCDGVIKVRAGSSITPVFKDKAQSKSINKSNSI